MAITIMPHMHLLGQGMPVTATPTDAKLVPLIRIKNGILNWQESDSFREPVKLRKDTGIVQVAHFDNSSKGCRNSDTENRLQPSGLMNRDN